MKERNISENTCRRSTEKKNEEIVKKNDDYCIINGSKIEGNACSTIQNDK